MENKEQKTPEQWFMELKEPYRSEAIANIDKSYFSFVEYPIGEADALNHSFEWEKSPQGHGYWDKIYNSLLRSETTYLEQTSLKPEQMDWKNKFEESQENYSNLISEYNKLLAHNDELTNQINEFKAKESKEKVYFFMDKDFISYDFEKSIEEAVARCTENHRIFEAICIGVKKSVLVNE